MKNRRPFAPCCASMRPPDLPGGNIIAQKKGAGSQRLASMRPPDLPGGNLKLLNLALQLRIVASMRPPDLPGGNSGGPVRYAWPGHRFNEAAGFTRRKQ